MGRRNPVLMLKKESKRRAKIMLRQRVPGASVTIDGHRWVKTRNGGAKQG